MSDSFSVFVLIRFVYFILFKRKWNRSTVQWQEILFLKFRSYQIMALLDQFYKVHFFVFWND
jgi:hypothetical protein